MIGGFKYVNNVGEVTTRANFWFKPTFANAEKLSAFGISQQRLVSVPVVLLATNIKTRRHGAAGS